MEICQPSCRFAAVPPHFNYASVFSFPSKVETSRIFRCSTITAASSSYQSDKLERRSTNRMFILGLGYVGQMFAEVLNNQDWVVSGTCTSFKKKKELEERRFDVYHFNANEPELMVLNILKQHTHLLVSIPPVLGIGDPMLQHEELLRSTLMDQHLQWLGYLSSTGVYGDCGGAWIDEDYQPNPTTDLGKLRLAAEEGWLSLGHDLGISAQVFRLGGIYGPGRSAVDTIIKQESLSKNQRMRGSRQYTSRIHVDDVCQALEASIQKPSSRKVYNVVDDDPAPREEVFSFARNLVEEKWPGWLEQSTLLEKPESFNERESSRGEKRVSNARMKKELGVGLQHPCYKSGLQSIIDRMEKPC